MSVSENRVLRRSTGHKRVGVIIRSINYPVKNLIHNLHQINHVVEVDIVGRAILKR